jgi:hypothetical protein
MPTTSVEVKVILYKGTDADGNVQYALDIDPLVAVTSPLDEDGNPVDVVWKLEIRPPNAVPPNVELSASFNAGGTPFNPTSTVTEHFDTNAGSPSGAHSGPVHDGAVGGSGQPDPNDQHLRPYKYTVSVKVKNEAGELIKTLEIDPSVVVRRRGIKRHNV